MFGKVDDTDANESTIVPFGKYRGRPVEVLDADPDYHEWLRAQGWYRRRFAWLERALEAARRGTGAAPAETPEHNRLQALFLSEDFRRAYLVAAGLRARLLDEAHWGVEDAEQRLECARGDRTRAIEEARRRIDHAKWMVDLSRGNGKGLGEVEAELVRAEAALLGVEEGAATRVEEARARLEGAVSAISDPATEAGSGVGVQFEVSGVDAVLSGLGYHCLVECKPTLGDDYPAVLRQVRAARERLPREARGGKAVYATLFVGELRSEVLTLEGLREFMPFPVVIPKDVADGWIALYDRDGIDEKELPAALAPLVELGRILS